MAGNGLACIAARTVRDELRHPFGPMFAASHFDEGAHRGADHVAKETVGGDAEVPVAAGRTLLSHDLDLSGIAVLPTQPLCEVEIGIAAPRKADRSPAAERFMSYALENKPALT